MRFFTLCVVGASSQAERAGKDIATDQVGMLVRDLKTVEVKGENPVCLSMLVDISGVRKGTTSWHVYLTRVVRVLHFRDVAILREIVVRDRHFSALHTDECSLLSDEFVADDLVFDKSEPRLRYCAIVHDQRRLES